VKQGKLMARKDGLKGVESQGGPPPKLLVQVRELMRVRRYALRTERAYCDWIRRYVKFHGMQGREDLQEGTRKVEEFLTHLAVSRSSASP